MIQQPRPRLLKVVPAMAARHRHRLKIVIARHVAKNAATPKAVPLRNMTAPNAQYAARFSVFGRTCGQIRRKGARVLFGPQHAHWLVAQNVCQQQVRPVRADLSCVESVDEVWSLERQMKGVVAQYLGRQ